MLDQKIVDHKIVRRQWVRLCPLTANAAVREVEAAPPSRQINLQEIRI